MRFLLFVLFIGFVCSAQNMHRADSLFKKGEELKFKKECKSAAIYYEQASQLELESQNPRYDSLAKQLRALAICQIKDSLIDNAQQNLEKIIVLYDKNLLKNNKNFTFAANDLATIFYNRKDYFAAISYYERVLATVRTDNGKINKDYAYVLSRFCLLYTSPSPRDLSTSRMPSSA